MSSAAPLGVEEMSPGRAGLVAAGARRDECHMADGTVREQWRQVADELAALGPSGLVARRDELTRLLRNEGATYNVGREGVNQRRPWSLDPVPFVLDEVEWTGLEQAVSQRVALLDLVAADLCGDRRLVAEGLLPAELVLGDPAFLRACAGRDGPGVPRLFLTAVDVVCDSAGRFRAVGDRTQAPSGLGYALVNRSALSRVLPTLHRASGVERLAGFFRAIRAGVTRAAPDGVDEPRAVILTPGPASETYFEHAYLASYLGIPLVEGRDLLVENNRVWLRSLAGLDAVDVILRRIDDQWCDPVELRADSLLGVPGLVEAVRRGRVAVLNPLGSGLLENPALTALLEEIARPLLGEELILRGPDSWWCGRRGGRIHVLACLGDLILFPVRPAAGIRPVVPGRCSREELDQLRDRIMARPEDWVGQEVVEPSTVPTVTDTGSLEPRPVGLRTFAVADGTDPHAPGIQVLPGGTDQGRGAPGLAGHLEPGGRDQQGHLGRVVRTGAPAEPLAAGAEALDRPCHRPRRADSAPGPGSRPALRPGPQRRARRAGHPSGPYRPSPS